MGLEAGCKPALTDLKLLLIFVLGICLLPGDGGVRAADRTEIVDQMGRRLSVVRPYERIISLYAAHTENLFALGLDAGIIGASRSETYPPPALERPIFSYREDPERLLAVRPDLVLTRPMIDGGYPHFVARLEQMGITVASLQPTAPEQIFDYWRDLGRLTGRQRAADALVGRFEVALAAFRELTRDVAPKKRVYFEAIHRRMKTFSPSHLAIWAVEPASERPS